MAKEVQVKIIENNDISSEEEQKIWNKVFDLLLKKSILENESSENSKVEVSDKLLKY